MKFIVNIVPPGNNGFILDGEKIKEVTVISAEVTITAVDRLSSSTSDPEQQGVVYRFLRLGSPGLCQGDRVFETRQQLIDSL